eukprot:TRINITY_DN456_c0_g1_i9.p3 TRINITY_DN456_c0_g1~~TRINITY_DN456_c0_g1_i9.p3  ORF type:complete len:171 (-),score=11.32 TRINITY_DN456_c0_g1_i9:694-1206(-)
MLRILDQLINKIILFKLWKNVASNQKSFNSINQNLLQIVKIINMFKEPNFVKQNKNKYMTKLFLKLIKNIEKDQLKKNSIYEIEKKKIQQGNVARIKTFLQEIDPNTGEKKYNQSKIQTFEGIITKVHRAGLNSTIKINRISKGVQIERIFLIYSPIIHSIEIFQLENDL